MATVSRKHLLSAQPSLLLRLGDRADILRMQFCEEGFVLFGNDHLAFLLIVAVFALYMDYLQSLTPSTTPLLSLFLSLSLSRSSRRGCLRGAAQITRFSGNN